MSTPPLLYNRIVLALNGGPTDRLVVRLGCDQARGREVELYAVHVVEVDWRHELSEDIASTSEEASAVLDRAEAIAEKYHLELHTELLQARDIGAALVDEATELGADLIVVGLPYRTKFGGDFAIGRTIPYILQNAPCTVVVLRDRVGGREEQIDGDLSMPLTEGRALGL